MIALLALKEPRRRNRYGVKRILWLAPKGEKHTKRWWFDWFTRHWEG